jgi:hypothetical protein
MAKTNKRQRPAYSLTLAAPRGSSQTRVLRALVPAASGKSTGSLPARLPAGLPTPGVRTSAPPRPWRANAPGSANRSPYARPRESGPILREPEAFCGLSGPRRPKAGSELGPPLGIVEVACLIGCSPWTVRQTLIPQGLPHFRFTANGRLVFYRDQVIRWIEKAQGGQQ